MDGEPIWIRENGKYARDDTNGRKIVSLCIDITEMKNAEEKARYNEQLANIALESTSISIWEYDFKTKSIIQGHNSAVIHGFDTVIPNIPQSFIDSEYVHPDSAHAFARMYEDLANGAKKAEGVFKIRTTDRSGYWYEQIHYTNTFDKKGMPYRAIGISSDVTEQRMMLEQYEREIEFNKTLPSDIFSTIRVNFTRNRIEESHTDLPEDRSFIDSLTLGRLPEALARITGITDEAAAYFRSLTRDYIGRLISDDTHIISYEYVRNINGIPVVSFELHIMTDPINNDLLAFIYFRNIDKQHREMERLKQLAERDQMTGLYNHDTTLNLIKEYLTDEGIGQKHALFMVDVNKFKSINDKYGHMPGDHVLAEVARRIRSVFRNDDIVGRIGGDEFMALIKNISSVSLAEKKAVELANATHFSCSGISMDISCSIGVALFDDETANFAELYRKADAAMYRAKQSGGTGYIINTD